MRAFLEKNEFKDYLDDFVYISKYELMNRGIEVVDFDGTDLKNLERKAPVRGDICIGSVQACERFFELVGINRELYKYIGFPKELFPFYKRHIGVTDKLPEVFDKPFFIKPRVGVKSFTGCVVDSAARLEFVKKYCPDITGCDDMYITDTLDIVSEYRCFVSRIDLVGIQWYAGDFTVMLDAKMIEEIKSCIERYLMSPIAYTLDFGILRDGSLVLIEINDMWAIGSYGLSAKIYVDSTMRRFNELYRVSMLINMMEDKTNADKKLE